MSTALVRIDDLRGIGKVLAESGYFKDAVDEAKAIVKVLAGQELGIGPIASMTGINIIQGKPAIGAGLMASMVKRSGKYDYRVRLMGDDAVEVEFFQEGKSIGVSTFTVDDARKAGTQNMQKFPRNMLFARAMSNGVKWFCPDVFISPVYTPEELGARVDESGEIIEGEIVSTQPAHVLDGGKAEYKAAPAEQRTTTGGNGRPFDPQTLASALAKKANAYRKQSESWQEKPDEKQAGILAGELNRLVGGDDRRHAFLKAVTGKESIKDIDMAMKKAIQDWIDKDAQMATIEANLAADEQIEAAQTVMDMGK